MTLVFHDGAALLFGDAIAASPITVAVGTATEAEGALALTAGAPVVVPVGTASETEGASALGASVVASSLVFHDGTTLVFGAAFDAPPVTITLGTAAEAEGASSLTAGAPASTLVFHDGTALVFGAALASGAVVIPLGTATDYEEADRVPVRKVVRVGRASESESGRVLAPTLDGPASVVIPVATAVESESATVLRDASPRVVVVGTAFETEGATQWATPVVVSLAIAREREQARPTRLSIVIPHLLGWTPLARTTTWAAPARDVVWIAHARGTRWTAGAEPVPDQALTNPFPTFRTRSGSAVINGSAVARFVIGGRE